MNVPMNVPMNPMNPMNMASDVPHESMPFDMLPDPEDVNEELYVLSPKEQKQLLQDNLSLINVPITILLSPVLIPLYILRAAIGTFHTIEATPMMIPGVITIGVIRCFTMDSEYGSLTGF